MFKISEFAQFSRVSVKMLRHYDDIGLLHPAYVDPFTNYRYYSAGQLPRLHRIIALKDLGFTLAQIGVILDESLSSAELRGLLKGQRAETRRELQAAQTRLAQLDDWLATLVAEDQLPTYEVIVRPIPPEWIATISSSDDDLDDRPPPDVSMLFEQLETYVAQHNARAARPPFLLFHAPETEGPDMEVAVPIGMEIPTGNRITVRRLPGHEYVACVLHTGRYDMLSQAYSALLNWIEAHDYQPAGPLREVYLRFGADQQGYSLPEAYLAQDTSEFVTELQAPIRVAQRPKTGDSKNRP